MLKLGKEKIDQGFYLDNNEKSVNFNNFCMHLINQKTNK